MQRAKRGNRGHGRRLLQKSRWELNLVWNHKVTNSYLIFIFFTLQMCPSFSATTLLMASPSLQVSKPETWDYLRLKSLLSISFISQMHPWSLLCSRSPLAQPGFLWQPPGWHCLWPCSPLPRHKVTLRCQHARLPKTTTAIPQVIVVAKGGNEGCVREALSPLSPFNPSNPHHLSYPSAIHFVVCLRTGMTEVDRARKAGPSPLTECERRKFLLILAVLLGLWTEVTGGSVHYAEEWVHWEARTPPLSGDSEQRRAPALAFEGWCEGAEWCLFTGTQFHHSSVSGNARWICINLSPRMLSMCQLTLLILTIGDMAALFFFCHLLVLGVIVFSSVLGVIFFRTIFMTFAHFVRIGLFRMREYSHKST